METAVRKTYEAWLAEVPSEMVSDTVGERLRRGVLNAQAFELLRYVSPVRHAYMELIQELR